MNEKLFTIEDLELIAPEMARTAQNHGLKFVTISELLDLKSVKQEDAFEIRVSLPSGDVQVELIDAMDETDARAKAQLRFPDNVGIEVSGSAHMSGHKLERGHEAFDPVDRIMAGLPPEAVIDSMVSEQFNKIEVGDEVEVDLSHPGIKNEPPPTQKLIRMVVQNSDGRPKVQSITGDSAMLVEPNSIAAMMGAVRVPLVALRKESVKRTLPLLSETFTKFPTSKGPFFFQVPVSGRPSRGFVPTSGGFGQTQLTDLRQEKNMIVGIAKTNGSVDDLINDTNEVIARLGFQLEGDPLFDEATSRRSLPLLSEADMAASDFGQFGTPVTQQNKLYAPAQYGVNKAPKEQVNYRAQSAQERVELRAQICETCRFLMPIDEIDVEPTEDLPEGVELIGRCEIVEGDILQNWTCDLWYPNRQRMSQWLKQHHAVVEGKDPLIHQAEMLTGETIDYRMMAVEFMEEGADPDDVVEFLKDPIGKTTAIQEQMVDPDLVKVGDTVTGTFDERGFVSKVSDRGVVVTFEVGGDADWPRTDIERFWTAAGSGNWRIDTRVNRRV